MELEKIRQHTAGTILQFSIPAIIACILYTSDAADESHRVDLGGRRIIKKFVIKPKRN